MNERTKNQSTQTEPQEVETKIYYLHDLKLDPDDSSSSSDTNTDSSEQSNYSENISLNSSDSDYTNNLEFLLMHHNA